MNHPELFFERLGLTGTSRAGLCEVSQQQESKAMEIMKMTLTIRVSPVGKDRLIEEMRDHVVPMIDKCQTGEIVIFTETESRAIHGKWDLTWTQTHENNMTYQECADFAIGTFHTMIRDSEPHNRLLTLAMIVQYVLSACEDWQASLAELARLVGQPIRERDFHAG
jgi:hypothetical protein